MENVQELDRAFRRILQLKSSPVAVRIIKNHEEMPVLFKRPEKPLSSFCFAVMESFKGKGFFLTRADVQCTMGLTTLGLRKEGSKLGKNKQGVQIGVFGNEQAAQNYFSKGICLPAGQTQGVAMSPLEKAVMGVDVVLFKVNSEQAMWLLTATQYLTGGRNDLSVGTGFQGVCGDAIAYPLMNKKVNLTVNGVGDRIAATMGKNELFMGIPAQLISKIAANLLEICHKPIFKAHHSPRGFQKALSSRNGPRP
ncbi:MAG: DUF169 domain-containing protein [Deltaproteobacteria bacterium]|nr:DUF169 domain-containing protein [Deltaproteobacteria bacterium]